MDKICIKRLEVFAFHGIYEEEKRLGQKFYISAELHLDTRAAARNDDLTASVNYGEVCKQMTEFTQNVRWQLIETAADRMAEFLLIQYPVLQKVVIELEKPGAPIPYPLETVMVHVERCRHRAYLSIGSNIGDRRLNLATACQLLADQKDVWITKQSPVYETAPYGYIEQPVFLNACLEIETLKSPEELLELLQQIENQLRRTREIHWGPRTIDLDILFYDQCIIDTNNLHVPHPDMHNRMFVLQPLSDIAGYMRHPGLGKTIDELKAILEKQH